MNFIFISACVDEALSRSRKVLDAYATRMGPRTWHAILHEEGLDYLHRALLDQASKTSAIACHHIKPHGEPALRWIVGSRRPLTSAGTAPLHAHQAPEATPAEALIWFMQASGLLHDIGKNTAEFYSRVRSTGPALTKDYRHEVLSAVWLKEAFVHHDGKLTASGWDAGLSKQATHTGAWPVPDVRTSNDLLTWLVASHHSLPPANRSLRGYEPRVGYRAHEGSVEIRDLTLTPGHAVQQENLDAITPTWNSLLEQKPADPALAALPALAVYGRLAFKLIDFEVSRRVAPAADPTCALANSAGQALDYHLLEESKLAPELTHKVLALAGSELPALHPEARGDIDAAAPPAFDWQNRAAEAICANRPAHGYRGFFGVVAAGTGTGKTRACARILSALAGSEGLRYNVLLGLRSLTLQTGNEYQRAFKLSDFELATLIGCRATRELNATEPEDVLQETVFGADHGFFSPEMSRLLESLPALTTDQQRLLSAPVLVCTTDYIACAANLAPRRSWIIPLLRLLTSDLVLDEVDNYDLTDLVALCRLVWAAGVLGRRVLVSSATISPILSEALFGSYRQGWQSHAAMQGWTDAKLHAGIFSNAKLTDAAGNDRMNLVLNPESSSDFNAAYQSHCETTVKLLKDQPVKRKMALLEGLFGQAASLAYGKIVDNIAPMHQHHSIPAGEKRLSVGLIRTARVYDCIQVAKEICRHDFPSADLTVKVVAYHAKHLLGMRHFIEQDIDAMLKRPHQPGEDDPILKHPRIQKILAEATTANVAIIIVATPVEEVGRDHDFDWAIAEPSSWRSLIQLAGRILRHRTKEVAYPNLLVMETSFAALRGHELAFSKPGYELLSGTGMSNLKSQQMQHLIDFSTMTAVNAEPVLNLEYPGDFAKIEREALSRVAKNARPLQDGAGIWNDGHAHEFPFRHNSAEAVLTIWLTNQHKTKSWSLLQQIQSSGNAGTYTETADEADSSIPFNEANDLPSESRLFQETLSEVVETVARQTQSNVNAPFLKQFFFLDIAQNLETKVAEWFAPHIGFCPPAPKTKKRSPS